MKKIAVFDDLQQAFNGLSSNRGVYTATGAYQITPIDAGFFKVRQVNWR